MVEHCRKYTMGYGAGRDSRPGYRPWSCGDRAGVLPAPAGGVVVVVGCTVFHMRRGGVLWALQVRILHAPAVAGHAAVPDPLVGVRACTLGGSRDTWRSRTPRGGRSRTPSVCAERPSLEGHVTSLDPFPSRRWVRTAGVGRIVMGAVPSTSRTASQVPTVLPQRPGWRSSDRSWRTGLRSQPLWGMAA